MTKLQRWLDVIAYLVGRRVPVTVDELMENIPAYAAKWQLGDEKSRATARRTFERDKDELRQAGIPIRTVRYSVNYSREELEGYRIDRRDFYLPYLRLIGERGPTRGVGYRDPARVAEVAIAPEHLRLGIEAAERAARLPAFPLESAARSALRKLAFGLSENPTPASSPVLYVESGDVQMLRERLRLLSDALLLRKRVRFRYHGLYRGETTERDVAPYGLLFQQGNWYLVGHDALRDDVRVFHVGRMDDVQRNTRVPNTPDYTVPPDFRLSQHVGRRPWELGASDDEVLRARVLFHFPLAIWAERNRYGSPVRAHADGSVERAFEVRHVDPFVRWVLGCEGAAEVLEPDELRAAVRDAAARILRMHERAGREVANG